ncbi:RNA polymerase sigma factor [Ekhidna sp.]|uniref:RNA polymerase sigma factor n=1 Tax=Ekhidna sp. TaxID=2608089 RepID=UPI0032999973
MNMIPITETKNNKLSEKEIVQKVLAGEKGLYEILLRRNNQKLYRVLRGYLPDHTDIEDVMQDTYMTAYEKLWQYRLDSAFSTWLIRIGINKALYTLKKTKQTVYLASEKERSVDIKDKSHTPENKLIQMEAKQMLEAAIGQLDRKYRSAYIMKEIEGMSIAEISDCLDLSISNVKVRIHRAKTMIKENLYDQSQATTLFEFGFSKCDNLVEKVMAEIL